MKRLLITEEFRKAIKNSDKSMRKLSLLLGFEVKNLVNKNKTINQEHLQEIEILLGKKFDLIEEKICYELNLGKYSEPEEYLLPNLKEKGNSIAELIGIMLGDGNLYKNRIRICCDKREIGYIKYLKCLFFELFKINLREEIYKNTNQAYLYCYNEKLSNELIKLGLIKGDKIINQVSFPKWIRENDEYSKNCIRGLIDTDGCIYLCKREKRRYVKFTNFNSILLKDFKEIALRLGYHFAKANSKNVCLYRKNEVARFINEIKPIRAGQGS